MLARLICSCKTMETSMEKEVEEETLPRNTHSLTYIYINNIMNEKYKSETLVLKPSQKDSFNILIKFVFYFSLQFVLVQSSNVLNCYAYPEMLPCWESVSYCLLLLCAQNQPFLTLIVLEWGGRQFTPCTSKSLIGQIFLFIS